MKREMAGINLDDLKEQALSALDNINSQLKNVELPSSGKELLQRAEKYNKRFEGIEFLQQLEEQTGVPKAVFAAGIAFAGLIFTILSFNVKFLGAFTTSFIGYAYPAYASIKAIESERKDDDTVWLTYWVVYAFFFIFEMIFLGPMSGFSSLGRSYFVAKVLVLIWCQFGAGARILYKGVVHPAVIVAKTLNEQLDQWLDQFEEYSVKNTKKRAPKDEDEHDDDDDE